MQGRDGRQVLSSSVRVHFATAEGRRHPDGQFWCVSHVCIIDSVEIHKAVGLLCMPALQPFQRTILVMTVLPASSAMLGVHMIGKQAIPNNLNSKYVQ